MRGVGGLSPMARSTGEVLLFAPCTKTKNSHAREKVEFFAQRPRRTPACPPIQRMGWGGRGRKTKIVSRYLTVFSWEFLIPQKGRNV